MIKRIGRTTSLIWGTLGQPRTIIVRMLSEPSWPFSALRAQWKLSKIQMDEIAFASYLLAEANRAQIQRLFGEITGDRELIDHISGLMGSIKAPKGTILSGMDWEEAQVLYTLTRLLKPDAVVETGVAGGITSAFILAALRDNARGTLFSVDLPAAGLVSDGLRYWWPPENKPGWLIPDPLRVRWNLILGTAEDKLGPLLAELGEVGIFLHDSLHTFRHQRFEYNTAWPHIMPGGLLLSHDVSAPYLELCSRVGKVPVRFRKLGGIRKSQ